MRDITVAIKMKDGGSEEGTLKVFKPEENKMIIHTRNDVMLTIPFSDIMSAESEWGDELQRAKEFMVSGRAKGLAGIPVDKYDWEN